MSFYSNMRQRQFYLGRVPGSGQRSSGASRRYLNAGVIRELGELFVSVRPVNGV